jgi:phosphatidylserine/phosphatidylglycerophosphate/cardiolipin synthase-like enzyme
MTDNPASPTAIAESKPRKQRFPWRRGNHFTLLNDASAFYPAMRNAIDGARLGIDMEMYLFESGHVADGFIDAFIRAARRGVRVRVLLDDFGAHNLMRHDRARLAAAGVELLFYNPLRYAKLRHNLRRDHRKLLVVDGSIAFTGGAGISDVYEAGAGSWRDTMVSIRGPVVADWRALFERTWQRWSDETGPAPMPPAARQGGSPGRVATTYAPASDDIKRAFVTRVRRARHRVWLATAYFVPAWKLRRALRKAARRGVDVRLLLPGPRTDHPAIRHAGRRFYSRLLRNGVRIYEYQPRFLHAKMLLVDDWVSIGSSNVDRWNLRWNLEANQEIDDPAFAAQLAGVFITDFSDSREYDYRQWHRRPWYRRWLEAFWGRIDVWLERR